MGEFKRMSATNYDDAVDWVIRLKAGDEYAKDLAYSLDKFVGMSKSLKDGSNIEVVCGSHGVLMEKFLSEVAGLDSVKNIGGAFGYVEGVDFIIKSNDDQVDLKMNIRGKEYYVDMDKVVYLAKSYVKDVKPLLEAEKIK